MTEEETKKSARQALRNALRKGELRRALRCERCGVANRPVSDGRSYLHAHHCKGYDHPLDVEWLCPKCHFKIDLRPSGENNGRTKLTLDQVYEIRRRYNPKACAEHPKDGLSYLGREFGVHPSTIERIVKNRGWKDQ